MNKNVAAMIVTAWLFNPTASLPANAEAPPLPDFFQITGQNWCPYICSNKSRPGFISEYIQLMAKDLGYRASITIQPFKHALSATRKGRYDALMLASPNDTQDLLFPVQEIINRQICFYTRPYDVWNYRDESSLNSKKLGGIKNHYYSNNLNSYLKNHPLEVSIASGSPLAPLVARLENKKLDVLIADRYVLLHQLQKRSSNPLREAGCLKPQPYYFGLSPKLPGRYRLLPKIENWLRQQNSKVLLNGLLAKYHLMP